MKTPKIKFVGSASARDELLASLGRLAELGEQLDGPYRLAAAYFRQQLSVGVAGRLKRRDALIVEFRFRYLPHLSNNAAAPELQSQLNRYAASAWRARRSLDEPTPAEFGTHRELLWRILKESDGQVLKTRTTRKIIDSAPKQQRYLNAGDGPAPIGNISSFHLPTLPSTIEPSAQKPESPLNARPSFNDVLPIVRELPGFKGAEEKAHAKLVAERQGRLDELARLEAEAAKAYPRHEKLKAEKRKAREDAARALKFAEYEYWQTEAAIASERFANEQARRAHETALIDGEWPELAAFRDLCYVEIERAEKALAVHSGERRNARTGKTERFSSSNWRSVNARLAVIRLSMRDAAPALRMIADPRQLPAEIEKLIQSWPPIADPTELGEA